MKNKKLQTRTVYKMCYLTGKYLDRDYTTNSYLLEFKAIPIVQTKSHIKYETNTSLPIDRLLKGDKVPVIECETKEIKKNYNTYNATEFFINDTAVYYDASYLEYLKRGLKNITYEIKPDTRDMLCIYSNGELRSLLMPLSLGD